jgi:hypothetical protein
MDITGIGSIADFAKSIVDRIFPRADPNEKLKAQTQIRQMIEERENTVVNAKASIMIAELQQDDKFTKRGRPTVLYAGLLFIAINHVLFPIFAWIADVFVTGSMPDLPALNLPNEFWWAWGGVCSVYVIGRTHEKVGADAGLMSKIFGKVKNQQGAK